MRAILITALAIATGSLDAIAASPAGSDVTTLIAQLESSDREERLAATTGFLSIGPIGAYSKPAVTQLVVLLQTDDDEVRISAITALERIGSQANLTVPALIAALHDPNVDVRYAAANALARYSTRAALVIPALIKALNDPEPAIVFAAANALSHMGTPAVSPLTDMLHQKNPYVRAAAAGSLGGIGLRAQPALDEILPLTNDRDGGVRVAAVRAIGQIASEQETAVRVYGGLEYNLERVAFDLAAERERRLRQAKSAVARAALPQLVTALRDPLQEVRFAAAIALRAIGEAAAPSAEDLIDAIDDESPKVRRAIASALGHVAPANIAVPALTAMATDSDLNVAWRAQSQITHFGDAAVPPLVTILAGDANPEIRAAAATALGELRTEAISGSDALIAAQSDPDAIVRDAATAATEAMSHSQ
jgi:HEAT repeat protein